MVASDDNREPPPSVKQPAQALAPKQVTASQTMGSTSSNVPVSKRQQNAPAHTREYIYEHIQTFIHKHTHTRTQAGSGEKKSHNQDTQHFVDQLTKR
jgi:hypothetical protein